MSLELRNISVSFADGDETLVVLDDISLTVANGETLAVTGASGSGKSTLLAVAGLLRAPDSGTVAIDGVDAPFGDNRQLARTRRKSIGFVFQQSNLFPSLTAIEQLLLVSHIAGGVKAEDRKRAEALLDAVGLSSRRDQLPSRLSGGERQRVGIARALMSSPSVLLADEPTASLDPQRGREIVELLTDQARLANAATVIVTHDQVAARAADREIRLGADVESAK